MTKQRLLTGLFASMAISGIILTGCEMQDDTAQLIVASAGIMLACIGGYFLTLTNRR